MLDLNNPDTRQNALSERLKDGSPLVATALADELGISIDTIRRDLIALEKRGIVRRVRGGALPVSSPMEPYPVRAADPELGLDALAERAVSLLPEDGTVFLDAGTTLNAIAAQLALSFRGLVVTPAPSVALAALNRGLRVHLIGGPLCRDGAMSIGGAAEVTIGTIAADLCLLGACGLWPGFGLAAEDAGEAGVKRAMARASTSVAVVSLASKFARRGRHKVLELEEIDVLVTDAEADDTAPFTAAGIEVVRVESAS